MEQALSIDPFLSCILSGLIAFLYGSGAYDTDKELEILPSSCDASFTDNVPVRHYNGTVLYSSRLIFVRSYVIGQFQLITENSKPWLIIDIIPCQNGTSFHRGDL